MKKVFIYSITLTLTLALGFFGGWWVSSPDYDMLCSKSAVFTLGKDIEASGINIKSGTEIDLRSCEYANRFTVSLYYDKGIHSGLFVPKNSAVNIGNYNAEQYSVLNVK